MSGYIQRVEMATVEEPREDVVVLKFTGLCHAQQHQMEFNFAVVVEVYDRNVRNIVSGDCGCIAGMEMKLRSHRKHILAFVYALSAVVSSGIIPEWAVCTTSLPQSWGVGHSGILHGDLKPDRIGIYAHMLRPERRASWKHDGSSRVKSEFRIPSESRLAGLKFRISASESIYPTHLLRLIEEPVLALRVPRVPKTEFVNPFADHFTWPDSVPLLPPPAVKLTEVASKYLPLLSTALQVNQ